MSGLVRLVRGIVDGMKECKAVAGLGSSKSLGWRYEELQTTPYLHSPEYVQWLVDSAAKSGNKEQLEVVKAYLKKYKAEEAPSYRDLLNKINVQLYPPKTDTELLHELHHEVRRLKEGLLGDRPGISMNDAIDFLKELV